MFDKHKLACIVCGVGITVAILFDLAIIPYYTTRSKSFPTSRNEGIEWDFPSI